ncbi:hypothetical protein PM10SUCC1_17330 [Propionigenium maris DSM 9537]|uniref:Uncharacterized protein n=1 Tax=Propionigenium maris DSM 9537 TaxID=1123000 RepID=A0A9W6GLV2_9FUSO|nr:hypothetical protein PM10SUCC1_17330 [Propionigenium maris DSM 9537]
MAVKECKQYSEYLISKRQFDFETLEMVLHSINIVANNHKRQGDYEGEMKYFNEKEYIMQKLLNPVYIEEVGERAFVIYDALKHRYRIPMESFTLEEAYDFYEELPVRTHEKLNMCGEKIEGCLEEESIDNFYKMIKSGDYFFLPA